MAGKKQKYYAVARGRKPGVYETWEEAKKQVDGFGGCKHQASNVRKTAATWRRSLPLCQRVVGAQL